MSTLGMQRHLKAPTPVELFGWLTFAVVLGNIVALGGLPFLYGCIIVALVITYTALIVHFPDGVMCCAVCVLALAPFSLGIETGVAPKLFADELMLLAYLLLLLPIYWFSERTWQRGFATYYWTLAAFVICHCLSLLAGTDLIAFRNLLETFTLGPLLMILFLQEAANIDRHQRFADTVVWLCVVIAALSVLERVLQRNPVLEYMARQGGYQYLSPTIVAVTEGVYRPYVTFFHPSEAGTFMALGLPFAIRSWMLSRSWRSGLQISMIVVGLGVNATRGVWAAVAVSLLLLARRPMLVILSAIPALGLGGFLAYLALRTTPFMQRLSDLNNLFGRFIYWRLAIDVFADHKLLGVGHMQFQKVYLGYVHGVDQLAQIDLKQIYVIDNIYLTTLAEHGLVGFVALIALGVSTALMIRNLRSRLLSERRLEGASWLRAAQMVLVTYAVSGFFADVNQFTKATKFCFILIGFSLGVAIRSLRSGKMGSEKTGFVALTAEGLAH